MSFSEKEKTFYVWNLIKTTRGHMLKVIFEQNFQSSHQTDIPHRNDTRNLRRRDACFAELKILGWLTTNS